VSVLVGRGLELDAVLAFLDRALAGPGALLLEGEAGIGKTTLWVEGLERARDMGFRVLRARPSQAEAALPFAAIADLMEPALADIVDQIPAPQGRALETALLRGEPVDAPADQLAVSLAVLAGVRVLAEAAPVLIAVDDLPWLDAPSARVLAFALRRLESEPVGLLATRRLERGLPRGAEVEEAVPEARRETLVVGPLSLNTLDALLRDRLALALSRPRLEALLERSGGNPLHALELGRAVASGARLTPGEALPVAATLSELVEQRVADLSSATQRLLLEAAALSRPSVSMFTDRGEALDEALRSGLLVQEGVRLRFGHPLYGAAVYEQAFESERRGVHADLAASLEDPEERALHLALATSGPDEEVAAMLEEAARRAAARGAPDAAGDLLERARALTPVGDRGSVRRRLYEAAERYALAGETQHANELLDELIAALPPGPERGRAHLLAADEAFDVPGIVRHAEAAIADAGGDDRLLARAHARLGLALGGGGGDYQAWEAHAERAVTHAERLGDDALLARALTDLCQARFFGGGGLQRAGLECAIELERATGGPRVVYDNAPTALAMQLLGVGELDEARRIFTEQLARAVERGDAWSEYCMRAHLSEVERFAGGWERADALAAEAHALDRQIWEGRTQSSLFHYAMIRALLGQVEAAREAAVKGIEQASRADDHHWLANNRCVLGFLELSLGNVQAAADILPPLVEQLRGFGVGEPSELWPVPDALEALVAVGRIDEAEVMARELLATGERLDRAWALAIASRGLALVRAARGEHEAALDLAARALREHDRLGQPFELARTLLVNGSILRRAKQRGEAQRTLGEALVIFERLPAPLWAAKTREEIRRIGLRPSRDGGLTETETKVAGLVAAGRTNREVASELFLSVKTVEANLSRIYGKLGVRSRTELANRLQARDSGRT
jgi:DNA-binding CsgD family transcriptional regulator